MQIAGEGGGGSILPSFFNFLVTAYKRPFERLLTNTLFSVTITVMPNRTPPDGSRSHAAFRQRMNLRQRMQRAHGKGYFGGTCPICQRHFDNLVIDHDHTTEAIRSLICDACNTGLARFSDDPDILMRAAEYLKYHHGKRILGL